MLGRTSKTSDDFARNAMRNPLSRQSCLTKSSKLKQLISTTRVNILTRFYSSFTSRSINQSNWTQLSAKMKKRGGVKGQH